jgi:ketosteroid isomerase-like protein
MKTAAIRHGSEGAAMAIRFVMLLVCVGVPALHAQVEDSVRAVEMSRRQALLAADTVALSRMLAPDFIEISRLGTLRTRADNIRDIASGALHLTSIKYDSLNVRVYGDVAVLTGIADNTGTMHGFPFAGKIRYSRTFVRRDGRWQAVLMQQTPMQ